ncbi:MAG: hypothetical protein CI952_1514, partial [Methanohalophilus sp.]
MLIKKHIAARLLQHMKYNICLLYT